MIRWPYKWRKKEGCSGILPRMGGMQYRWDCLMENIYIRLAKLPKVGINQRQRSEKVVVSLTTFPKRINQCYYSIKSLMLQDYKADKIVLWLAEDQFPTKKLPFKFSALITAGLTVCYCDDLRSHKKYYYALQEQNEDEVVITFDDDIIYEENAISKLIRIHEDYPECIVCNRGHQMSTDDNGLLPYSLWKICSKVGITTPVYSIMPSTGAGCLYPKGSVPESAFDLGLIKENAWSADDIWMRFNSLSIGVKVIKTREKIATLCNVYGSQKEALTYLNDVRNENEKVIQRLQKIFPDVVKRYLIDEGNL